jgi:TetR/AcrR family transcriptional regulator, cholesterol catabolism regulator
MEEKNSIKDRILTTASELFIRFGFRSISMDDIAHHLGISKKTIYQFFADKDEIVTLAIHAYLQLQREELNNLKQTAKDAVDFLIRMNQSILRNIKDTNGALVFELRKYHSRAWALAEEFRNEFLYSMILEDLRAGIDEGVFRSDVNPEVIAKIRLQEAALVLDDTVFPRERYNFRDVSVTILDHFLYGIATDKGRRLYERYKTEILKDVRTSIL